MKKTLINVCKQLLVLLITLCFTNINAQKGYGYSVDSLQIKVYTEIDYVNYTPKDINIKKVFCDYCSESQIVGIGDEALRRSYSERNLIKNRLFDGRKKLALYIRISRADFAYLEHNREMSMVKYLIKNLKNNNDNSIKSIEAETTKGITSIDNSAIEPNPKLN